MARIESPFSSTSTALEVVEGIDLTGRRAVVTGASSGIGVETARALAHAGAQVTLAVRDTAAGERTAADIAATSGRDRRPRSPGSTSPTWRASTRSSPPGPARCTCWSPTPASWTPRTARPRRAGRPSSAPTTSATSRWPPGCTARSPRPGDARVVVVSSSGHAASPVVFDDLMFDRRPYDPGLAYGQSKTANVLFAVEATRRWADDGITANALMPGGIWTPLQRHWSAEQRAAAEQLSQQAAAAGLFRMKSTEQGAATSVFLATSPLVAGVGRALLRGLPRGRGRASGCTGLLGRRAPRAGPGRRAAAVGGQRGAGARGAGRGGLSRSVGSASPARSRLTAGPRPPRPRAGTPATPAR